MTVYDNELSMLQQKVAQKKKLDAKLKELQNQRRVFDQKVLSLKVEYQSEQADVEKLEGRSLANCFYRLVGKMDGMLDEESRQAAEAKVKLDAAEGQLAAIERQMGEIHAQLRELSGCESEYYRQVEKKKAEMKAAGSQAGREILKCEEKIAFLKSRKKEIEEAVSAGNSALRAADSVLSELDEADGWNTFDMIGGGGLITHVAKHSHLDYAQDLIEYLQGKLCTFKSELADIDIQANMQVNMDDFLRFADFFFDGLFVDWTIGGRIHESKDSVHGVKYQIEAAQDKLRRLDREVDREIAGIKHQIEQLLVSE